MTSERCLWIARYIPYPLDAGAKVYSAKLAESLGTAGMEVRFVGLGKLDTIPGSSKMVHWVAVPGERRNEIAALISTLPNAAAVDATPAYRSLLEEQLRESWDYIVFDGYGTGWALERCQAYCRQRGPGRPTLVHVSHNHEANIWRSMAAEASGSWLRRLALWQNYRKVQALERRVVESVDLLTTITDEDGRSLGHGLPKSKLITLTPGYEPGYEPRREQGYEGQSVGERRIDIATPRRVIIIGSFRWVIKQDNLARFVELADTVFQRADIELHVVGDVPEELLARLRKSSKATHFHGFVQDVEPLMAGARIAVVPEAIGGGFKLKFLDYFFGRVPVATLRQAVAGLPPELRRQTLAVDSLQELIDTIVAHIDEFDLLNRLQQEAFAQSRALFTWKDRGDALKRAMTRSRYG